MRKGKLIIEGKTKRIWEAFDASQTGFVFIESKDDLTAGNGAKHDQPIGKGTLANNTACNIFEFLQKYEIPSAFVRRIDDTHFLARQCAMIPLEVVVRREAHGSFCKRYPSIPKEYRFSQPIVEFFLKTSNKQWNDCLLPVDDPFLCVTEGIGHLFLPDTSMDAQRPFMVMFALPCTMNDFENIQNIARRVFVLLEQAWKSVGCRLVDLKIEFGVIDGFLCIADVVDNDSWRVILDNQYIDKESYRRGADLDTVMQNYRLVEQLTCSF